MIISTLKQLPQNLVYITNNLETYSVKAMGPIATSAGFAIFQFDGSFFESSHKDVEITHAYKDLTEHCFVTIGIFVSPSLQRPVK